LGTEFVLLGGGAVGWDLEVAANGGVSGIVVTPDPVGGELQVEAFFLGAGVGGEERGPRFAFFARGHFLPGIGGYVGVMRGLEFARGRTLALQPITRTRWGAMLRFGIYRSTISLRWIQTLFTMPSPNMIMSTNEPEELALRGLQSFGPT